METIRYSSIFPFEALSRASRGDRSHDMRANRRATQPLDDPQNTRSRTMMMMATMVPIPMYMRPP